MNLLVQAWFEYLVTRVVFIFATFAHVDHAFRTVVTHTNYWADHALATLESSMHSLTVSRCSHIFKWLIVPDPLTCLSNELRELLYNLVNLSLRSKLIFEMFAQSFIEWPCLSSPDLIFYSFNELRNIMIRVIDGLLYDAQDLHNREVFHLLRSREQSEL